METVQVTYLGLNNQYQEYSTSDLALVNTSFITPSFGGPTDYIELFIKDIGGTIVGSNYDITNYTIGSGTDPKTGTTSEISLDPEADVRAQSFNRGSINTKYNFFRKLIASGPDPRQNFWIKEISRSRTEIRAARQDLSNLELSTAFNEFNGILGTDAYYPDFLLNFGLDVQIIAVNAVYVEEEGQGYVIFKLYEPLPTEYDEKSLFWAVSQVAEPAEFNVTINVVPDLLPTSFPLRAPNFKVSITDKISKTTPYYNYASLYITSVTSSYQQLKSMMDEKGIQINVDYSNFNNFIHFSSATERLYNFRYKVQQIESASSGLTSTNTSSSRVTLQDQIDNIIEKFDGYEYYLYFTSASTAWPKTSTTQPYPLYSATSSQVTTWLGSPSINPTSDTMSMYFSSSRYDNGNKDWLQYTTPGYIRDDQNNGPYLVFLDMIGQHFDNIWIYLKDLSNRYSAENNPFVGVSLDQVGDALRSFGINLYTNTNVSDNIYYSLLGINQTGSALPVTSSAYSRVNIPSSSLYPLTGQPYLTASLALPPFGQEFIKQYVTTFVTASAGVTSSFATLPADQLKNEIYKRLYHNLAYLLKTKGTDQGVKALITTYGIPEDILSVNEYGGYNIYDIAGIQELNNDNITTGSVLNISSSLLSPFTTLQYYQNIYDKTSPDVEVGFSPTNNINAAITSSGIVTASNDPGYFNIMQYIGDPNLQYTPTYDPLVRLENTFFDNTFTGNAQTGLTRFNVWDFIRTIKYYNNSLFKMIKDFVPARANLSTGIIIRSHILERNKYARHQPTAIIEGSLSAIDMVYVEGSAPGGYLYNTSYTASVPVQYLSPYIYMSASVSASQVIGAGLGSIPYISNTGVENYTGQYSGSTIFISNYFPQVDVSSYLAPNTSSVPYTAVSGNIMFTTYSINYLINNVTGSVLSQRFLELDYNANQIVPTNYGLVTQSLSQSNVIGPYSQSQQPYSQYSQIQDYNYYLRRSIMPRYSGSYLSGLYYNIYTPQNAVYPGDISYGSSPVINYYTSRLGLFTQIQSSSFIPGAVNASLAYQADVSGGLLELNQNNRNWQDIQNTFVAGETLTIKQFDNKKYSNQVATDGVKTIYNSGYNYTPQLYFNTSSDPKLYFEFAGTAIAGAFTAQNLYSLGNASGSASTPRYQSDSNGRIYNIFDIETSDTNTSYNSGSLALAQYSSFTASFAGSRTFIGNFSVDIIMTGSNQQVTYSFSATKNGALLGNGFASASFKSTQTPSVSNNGTVQIQNPVSITNPALVGGPDVYLGPFNVFNSSGTPIGTTSAGSWISASLYATTEGGGYFAINIGGTQGPYYDANGYLNSITAYSPGGGLPSDTYNPLINLTAASVTPPVDNLTTTLNLSISTDQASFNTDDKVLFQVLQNYTGSTRNFTASITQGNLTVNESIIAGNYPYASTSSGAFISTLVNNGSYGVITLSSDLSNYYTYQYVPYFTSGSLVYSSSLYNRYGDVNTTLIPQPYDKIILQDVNGTIQNLDVYTSSLNSGQLQITTFPTILTNWTANKSLVQNFLLLRRYEDEQNVILTFNKPLGQTSYGFLIPNTVSPQITNNINTLQAAVQSQLLSTQTAITTQ
jgi:hypothetical protein